MSRRFSRFLGLNKGKASVKNQPDGAATIKQRSEVNSTSERIFSDSKGNPSNSEANGK